MDGSGKPETGEAGREAREAFGINLELLLPFQISQLHTKLNAQARAIIARHGDLTLPQWRIIRLIGMGVAEDSTSIRKAAGIDKGQFSKTLNVLVTNGYVRAAPDQGDRRRIRLELTDLGIDVHDRLAPELKARNNHLLDALTETQREAVFEAIKALAAASERTEFDLES